MLDFRDKFFRLSDSAAEENKAEKFHRLYGRRILARYRSFIRYQIPDTGLLCTWTGKKRICSSFIKHFRSIFFRQTNDTLVASDPRYFFIIGTERSRILSQLFAVPSQIKSGSQAYLNLNLNCISWISIPMTHASTRYAKAPTFPEFVDFLLNTEVFKTK